MSFCYHGLKEIQKQIKARQKHKKELRHTSRAGTRSITCVLRLSEETTHRPTMEDDLLLLSSQISGPPNTQRSLKLVAVLLRSNMSNVHVLAYAHV